MKSFKEFLGTNEEKEFRKFPPKLDYTAKVGDDVRIPGDKVGQTLAAKVTRIGRDMVHVKKADGTEEAHPPKHVFHRDLGDKNYDQYKWKNESFESIDEDKKELHKELLKVKDQLDKVSSDIRHSEHMNYGGPVKAVQRREDLRDQYNKILKKLKSQHESIDEGKMSEIHAGIMSIVDKPDRHSIDIKDPSTHVRKNHDGTKRFTVYPVVYHTKTQKHKQGFQTYVHHEEGSTDVKPGLPPRRGGDKFTVESEEK